MKSLTVCYTTNIAVILHSITVCIGVNVDWPSSEYPKEPMVVKRHQANVVKREIAKIFFFKKKSLIKIIFLKKASGQKL